MDKQKSADVIWSKRSLVATSIMSLVSAMTSVIRVEDIGGSRYRGGFHVVFVPNHGGCSSAEC